MCNVPRLVALVAISCGPILAVAEDTPLLPLRVRLYSSSDMTLATITRAVDEASAILRQARVGLESIACGPAQTTTGDNPCTMPLATAELVVRLVNTNTGLNQRQAVSLGDALVDTRAKAGSLATIYVDRVEGLSDLVGCSVSALLGRAMAHEIGHLLLGTNDHAPRGIMRARWTPEQLKHDRPMDWRFPSDDGARLRQALHARRSGMASEPTDRQDASSTFGRTTPAAPATSVDDRRLHLAPTAIVVGTDPATWLVQR